MKNFKSLISIILAIFGLATFNSCSKNVTCECDLEDNNGATIFLDISGSCDDLEGEMDIYGYDYNIEDCKEE